jgi:hypothetical protein
MNNRVLYAIAMGVMACCTARPCLAQGFKVKSLGMIDTVGGFGSMVMNSGELISRDSVRVAFQLYKNADGDIEGYQLSKAGIIALKVGDKIPLHFVGIKVMGSYPGWRDNTGTPIKRDDFGAWREITLKSVQESGTRLAVAFEGEVLLEDGQIIRQLNYDVNDDRLTPARIARHPAGSPERYLVRRRQTFLVKRTHTSSWGLGEVISRDGVAVRFAAVAKDDGTFEGFKLASADLASLRRSDRVLFYFKGIKMTGNWDTGFLDPSGAKVLRVLSGGWRVVTIKGITRTAARIVVTVQETVELENGVKVNRLEFKDDRKWAMPKPGLINRKAGSQ